MLNIRGVFPPSLQLLSCASFSVSTEASFSVQASSILWDSKTCSTTHTFLSIMQRLQKCALCFQIAWHIARERNRKNWESSWDGRNIVEFKMQVRVQREQCLTHLNNYKKVGQSRLHTCCILKACKWTHCKWTWDLR